MTAISGTVISFKSMVDRSIRVTVEFQEPDAKAVKDLLCDVGATVAIARLNEPEGAGVEQTEGPDDEQVNHNGAKYGQQAKLLRLSGFFRMPLVWQAVGTDAQFLDWLRQQKCAACNKPAPSEVAHVRRIANGAGTGIKPEYSAIPLCHDDHRNQHQYGESKLFPKDGWDRLRIRYVEQWAWETAKALLGVEHWNEAHPGKLREWAAEKGVSQYLPSGYCE